MIRAHTMDGARSFGAVRNQGRKAAETGREQRVIQRAGRTSLEVAHRCRSGRTPRPALKPGAIYDGRAPPRGRVEKMMRRMHMGHMTFGAWGAISRAKVRCERAMGSSYNATTSYHTCGSAYGSHSRPVEMVPPCTPDPTTI